MLCGSLTPGHYEDRESTKTLH